MIFRVFKAKWPLLYFCITITLEPYHVKSDINFPIPSRNGDDIRSSRPFLLRRHNNLININIIIIKKIKLDSF